MLLRERIAWGLLAALALFVVAAMTGVVRGGELDPTGAPSSTMKTLDEIPGSWSRLLPADDGAAGPTPPAGCNSTRFQCVMGDEAVLDRETGLVWERSPLTVTDTWLAATSLCEGVFPGGRLGWRLPTPEEIQTLIDPGATAGTLALPSGYPFLDLQTDEFYWTSKSVSATFARGVSLLRNTNNFDKTTLRHFWCVRGGQGYNGI